MLTPTAPCRGHTQQGRVDVVAACPPAVGRAGIGDFHFTPGNPRDTRGWIRYIF